jgi:hypothetical protein
MAVLTGVALLAASAFLRPISSPALPSAPREFVGIMPPVVDDLVIQSVGYVVFDWSAAEGGVPGFAELPDHSKIAAN